VVGNGGFALWGIRVGGEFLMKIWVVGMQKIVRACILIAVN
jgi:hypothetical protein